MKPSRRIQERLDFQAYDQVRPLPPLTPPLLIDITPTMPDPQHPQEVRRCASREVRRLRSHVLNRRPNLFRCLPTRLGQDVLFAVHRI